jgi:hypothetical protein
MRLCTIAHLLQDGPTCFTGPRGVLIRSLQVGGRITSGVNHLLLAVTALVLK